MIHPGRRGTERGGTDPHSRRTEDSRIIRNTFFLQFGAFIVSSMTSSVGALVDGVIIGQCLGVDSIAAFGVISPLMIAFALIGAVISTGSRNRFTRLLGYGRQEEALGIFSLSVVLSVGVSLALVPVILLLAGPIAAALGASGNAAQLLPKAKGYLIGITIGLPAMNAMRVLNGYMAIDNDRYLPVAANAVLTAADILLDLLAAFVLHGDTFEMGLATSVSYYAAAAVLLLHFRKKNTMLRFSFRGLRWRETGGILTQGLPNGVCRIANTLRSMLLNRLLAVIAASAAIAAYSVHRQADSFLNPVTIGIADTVAMLAAVLAGEEDRPAIRRLLTASVQATLIVTAGTAAVFWILAPQFAGLYIKDSPEAFEMSVQAVRCYALGMPLYGLNLIYLNYFQGIGRSRLASITAFLLEGAFLVLSAAAMAGRAGAKAVWYAFPVTQALMVLYYLAVIACVRRREKTGGETTGDRLLLLPRNFDVPEEDRLDGSVASVEEAAALAGQVWDFCTRHGCDKRRRYLMTLSVEEMVKNVVEHGFTDGKHHSVNVRVLKKGDDYILRIRDDCLIFDPVKQLRLFSAEDRASHYGLRMITGLAKEVRYTCVLKLNNLVVRI